MIINFEIYGGNARLWLTFFFTLFAGYIAAALFYKYIEGPVINLGRKVVGKIGVNILAGKVLPDITLPS